MPVPILIYHQIATLPNRKMPFQNMLVDPDVFRRQMHWLKRLGYQGMSVREALPYIKGEKSGKVAAITFDDGYLNVLKDAAPVLADCGFTATNYFVANQVGGSNIWDRPIGVPEAACMNLAEMREWAALGHEVGAHSLDHVHLPAIAPEEAKRQIAECKTRLEDMLGAPVDSFCYPYGDNDPIHRQFVEEAGYQTATTIARARATPADDPFGLPRVYVKRKHSMPSFLLRLISA